MQIYLQLKKISEKYQNQELVLREGDSIDTESWLPILKKYIDTVSKFAHGFCLTYK